MLSLFVKMQDLELTFPWFKLANGTKAYMKGFTEDETLKTQDYPVVIWRKNFETASVFVVNGDYMEEVKMIKSLYTEIISKIQWREF